MNEEKGRSNRKESSSLRVSEEVKSFTFKKGLVIAASKIRDDKRSDVCC